MALTFNSGDKSVIRRLEETLFGDEGYGQISNYTDRLKQFANRVNKALSKVELDIIRFSNTHTWRPDNYNNTGEPALVDDIASGQKNYALPTETLEVYSVHVKDTAGNWRKLNILNEVELGDDSIEEFMDIPGDPIYYRKFKNAIQLYPASNYTQADSILVHITRNPSYLSYDDTTKTLGVPEPFEELIVQEVCADYAGDRGLANYSKLTTELADYTNRMRAFYFTRDKDTQPKFIPVYRSPL
jgi:hypothetical protein